jgi:APA family basic amino acid/polyamine antiporter
MDAALRIGRLLSAAAGGSTRDHPRRKTYLTQCVDAPARKLGLIDIVLLVVGSVIGSGIFRTPSVVAQHIHVPWLILGAWVTGGIVTLFGAFVLGELAVRRPEEGGAYAYLRDAFHPIVAFAYGWTSLLALFSGSIAASAVLFAGYFLPLTGLSISPIFIAVLTLALLAAVNALGVRQGSDVQNALAILKLAALAAVVIAAFAVHPQVLHAPQIASGENGGLALAFTLALVPVLFSYNGAVAANFMSAEAKHATRTLPRGLWIGMTVVAIIYVLVNAGCLRVLGVDGLAATKVPLATVLHVVAGPLGARLTSLAIALSTLGFISSRMLSTPRLYQAMADDGLFFHAIGRLNPTTRVPTGAIVLQGVVAIAIALSGDFDHIVAYVVSAMYLFNGLFAVSLFVLRVRDNESGVANGGAFRVPGHPFTTGIYLIASWAVTIANYVAHPVDGLIGLAIVLSAVPVYLVWKRLSSDRAVA